MLKSLNQSQITNMIIIYKKKHLNLTKAESTTVLRLSQFQSKFLDDKMSMLFSNCVYNTSDIQFNSSKLSQSPGTFNAKSKRGNR